MPIQEQPRHDFDGLSKSIRGVTGALHKRQQLDDSLFRFRTLHVELVSKAPAG